MAKSEMYNRGFECAAISFSYIPNFKNKKEKKDFEEGMKDGYKKQMKEVKENLESSGFFNHATFPEKGK